MAMRKLKKKEEATDVEAVTVDPLEAAFEAASAELARKRKAESMTVGDRITEFFRNIMDEWAKDIDKMDDDYLYTMEGKVRTAAAVATRWLPCFSRKPWCGRADHGSTARGRLLRSYCERRST
jgi:hypothetical protein